MSSAGGTICRSDRKSDERLLRVESAHSDYVRFAARTIRRGEEQCGYTAATGPKTTDPPDCNTNLDLAAQSTAQNHHRIGRFVLICAFRFDLARRNLTLAKVGVVSSNLIACSKISS